MVSTGGGQYAEVPDPARRYKGPSGPQKLHDDLNRPGNDNFPPPSNDNNRPTRSGYGNRRRPLAGRPWGPGRGDPNWQPAGSVSTAGAYAAVRYGTTALSAIAAFPTISDLVKTQVWVINQIGSRLENLTAALFGPPSGGLSGGMTGGYQGNGQIVGFVALNPRVVSGNVVFDVLSGPYYDLAAGFRAWQVAFADRGDPPWPQWITRYVTRDTDWSGFPGGNPFGTDVPPIDWSDLGRTRRFPPWSTPENSPDWEDWPGKILPDFLPGPAPYAPGGTPDLLPGARPGIPAPPGPRGPGPRRTGDPDLPRPPGAPRPKTPGVDLPDLEPAPGFAPDVIRRLAEDFEKIPGTDMYADRGINPGGLRLRPVLNGAGARRVRGGGRAKFDYDVKRNRLRGGGKFGLAMAVGVRSHDGLSEIGDVVDAMAPFVTIGGVPLSEFRLNGYAGVARLIIALHTHGYKSKLSAALIHAVVMTQVEDLIIGMAARTPGNWNSRGSYGRLIQAMGIAERYGGPDIRQFTNVKAEITMESARRLSNDVAAVLAWLLGMR